MMCLQKPHTQFHTSVNIFSLHLYVYGRGLPLPAYTPRGGGGQASNTFLLHVTCKKGEGVQIACKHAYVTNGSQ